MGSFHRRLGWVKQTALRGGRPRAIKTSYPAHVGSTACCGCFFVLPCRPGRERKRGSMSDSLTSSAQRSPLIAIEWLQR